MSLKGRPGRGDSGHHPIRSCAVRSLAFALFTLCSTLVWHPCQRTSFATGISTTIMIHVFMPKKPFRHLVLIPHESPIPLSHYVSLHIGLLSRRIPPGPDSKNTPPDTPQCRSGRNAPRLGFHPFCGRSGRSFKTPTVSKGIIWANGERPATGGARKEGDTSAAPGKGEKEGPLGHISSSGRRKS